jgi:NitT/TauT family transport system ATP-binding protein
MVQDPTVLLMDEPFAALDEITRFRLNQDLLTLQARTGMTVIFVTHSIYESVYLSSRIAVFSPRPGRITEIITVPEPVPRKESFVLSPLYAECCRIATTALRESAGGETMLGDVTARDPAAVTAGDQP